MCVGALVHARVSRVVFGAREPKTGALVSSTRALDIPSLNHRFDIVEGVLKRSAANSCRCFFDRGECRAGTADEGRRTKDEGRRTRDED